jgi:hypothetical protein
MLSARSGSRKKRGACQSSAEIIPGISEEKQGEHYGFVSGVHPVNESNDSESAQLVRQIPIQYLLERGARVRIR